MTTHVDRQLSEYRRTLSEEIGQSTLFSKAIYSLSMAAMADGLKERENLYKLMVR